MVGKSMRCPNLDCRQVFTVKPQAREVEPPKSDPVPVPSPRPLPPEPARGKKARPQPAVVEAQIVDAAVVAPPKVNEVVWSEGADLPPISGQTPFTQALLDETDDQPILRRKKKKGRGPVILIGMSIVIALLVGGAVIYIVQQQGRAEDKLNDQAKEEYKKGDYGAAAKIYEKLVADYPDGDRTPEYRFFAELSATQILIRSVTNRENPDAAVERLKKFLEAEKDSQFAKPKSGFGSDILEAGRKLGEDIAGHADDRVKAYRSDRSGKAGELERAEKAVATGQALLPQLEQFRAADDPPLDSIRNDLDAVEAAVKHERERMAAITKARSDLQHVSDANIQKVENDLAAGGFDSDDEARQLIADSKGKLLELVKYEPFPADPRSPPASSAATILFVSPVGPTRRAPTAGVGDVTSPSVFLALARGLLYAIEEDGGTLLWALRVGADALYPPTVAQIDLATGPTDVAVVTSNVDGISAVAAYVVRTGAPLWYQPLELPDLQKPGRLISIPAAGPSVVVGTRVFVPLRDETGTIFEFDLTTGTRRGRIRLCQPIGLNAIAVRPGTGLLYVAADARRVYVIDAGARDEDGNPLPLRCVQVIATGHLPGTVRTPPLVIGPEGDAPADRWMILSQAAGRTMVLRAFAVLPIQPPALDGKPPQELPAIPVVELPLDGWIWFPPFADGERLAVATDFGQFRLFGVTQFSSLDKPLFPYQGPSSALSAPPDGRAVRGVVFRAEEAAFWVVMNGNLQKFRLENIPSRGVEVTPVGRSVPVGEPTQPPQLNGRRDGACLVVRSLNSSGCKAVLINLRDGEFRWQRQLGIVPTTAPIPQANGVLLIAEDGGMVRLPATSGAKSGENIPATSEWVIAAPPENATGPTSVAFSADGKIVFAVTPVLTTENQKAIAKFIIRRVADGRLDHEGNITAPGGLAGSPAVVGGTLVLPMSDGFIYRYNPGELSNPDSLSAGPPWGGHRAHSEAICHITPLSATMFLTSDGGRKLTKWDWPGGDKWNQSGPIWELREPPAGAGLVLPPTASGNPTRFLVAGITGSVWMFHVDRAGQPLRRWQTGVGVPAGLPTSPLILRTGSSSRSNVVYTVDNKFLVCLDPDQDLPLWAARIGDDSSTFIVGSPQSASQGRWLATGLTGSVTVIEAATGRVESTLEIRLPGAIPAVAAVPLGERAIVATLSDGAAVVIPLPDRATGKP